MNSEGQKGGIRKLISKIRATAEEKLFKYAYELHEFFPNDKNYDFTKVFENLSLMEAVSDRKYYSPPIVSDSKVSADWASKTSHHIHVTHYDDGEIVVRNITPQEVRIVSANLLGRDDSESIDRVLNPSLTKITKLSFDTRFFGLHDKLLVINYSINGKVFSQNNYVTRLKFPNAGERRVMRPDKNSRCVVFEPGSITISEPIHILGCAIFRPGSTLYFRDFASILVDGYISAEGTRNNPIKLLPLGDSKWNGIYVRGDKKTQSFLRNVQIEGMHAFKDSKFDLTGGINFYQAPVSMEGLSIGYVNAEDAINFIKSDFWVKDLKIFHAYSDGIDADFSNGYIENLEASDVGGDALDLSGSNVRVNSMHVRRVGDKGISVGERSSIYVDYVDCQNTGVCVASKDGSSASIIIGRFTDSEYADIATFIKKDFYGNIGTELEIFEAYVANSSGYPPDFRFKRQGGTSLRYNGIQADAADIDVSELYTEGIMKK